jgi:hypothetical protein
MRAFQRSPRKIIKGKRIGANSKKLFKKTSSKAKTYPVSLQNSISSKYKNLIKTKLMIKMKKSIKMMLKNWAQSLSRTFSS